MIRFTPFVAALLLAGCVRPAAPVEPAPAPAPPPVSRPLPPAPAPIAADWRDWPQTPGDWSYSRGSAGSTARFARPGATAMATIRCEAGPRRIVLSRAVAGAGATALTVRTSSTVRALPAAVPEPGIVSATIAADDRLLDAMIYSRGRFTMEAPPAAPLALPAWAEVARVVEDCRG